MHARIGDHLGHRSYIGKVAAQDCGDADVYQARMADKTSWQQYGHIYHHDRDPDRLVCCLKTEGELQLLQP